MTIPDTAPETPAALALRLAREKEEVVEKLEVRERDHINPDLLKHAREQKRQHVTTEDILREVSRLVVMGARGGQKMSTRHLSHKFGVTTSTIRSWIKKARAAGFMDSLHDGRDRTVENMSEDRAEVARNALMAMKRKSEIIADLPDEQLEKTSLSEMINMFDRTEHSRKGADVNISMTPAQAPIEDLDKQSEELAEQLREYDKPKEDDADNLRTT